MFGEGEDQMSRPRGVNHVFGLLDDDEIELIGQLADNLDRSGLDLLELDIQGLQVSLAKTTLLDPCQYGVVPSAPLGSPSKDAPSENIVAITAPVIGFYRAQNMAGTRVAADTMIGAIAQINGDRPVSAGVNGILTEICVKNDQFVEYGQILGRIRVT